MKFFFVFWELLQLLSSTQTYFSFPEVCHVNETMQCCDGCGYIPLDRMCQELRIARAQ